MHKPPMYQTVQQLSKAGKSNRDISRILKISRNSVRKLLHQKNVSEAELSQTAGEQELVTLVKSLLSSCRGNLVRVHEILLKEHEYTLAYSTLTYLVRQHQLKQTPTKRFGEYCFSPGEEMQHDTSPHEVIINGKRVKAQCASLILGFSRKLFIQYYPRFTRFEAKVFLQQALLFMQGSCRRCIIDNTSVLLAAGAGMYAVIAPEMLVLSRLFGFEFVAHAVNHANRKGKIERPFYYAETNFLPGRTFNDWDDINRQAIIWCNEVANHKSKRALGMSAQAAYHQEQAFLQPLPEVMPPVYKHFQRTVDTQGYINVDCNRYSIPESHIGHMMDIYQYIDKIEIYYHHQLVTQHARIIDKRDQRSIIKGHHLKLYSKERLQAYSEAEKQLIGHTLILDEYIRKLKFKVRGRGGWVFKQLLHLKRLYPKDAFMQGIITANQYDLYDMKRLENIILKYIHSEFFNL